MTPPLDRVRLQGLRARGHHGVLAHERVDGQEFVIDVSLGLDTRAAAEHDDLARTVDYGDLAQRVVRAVERDPVDLLETLAQRLADVCLADARVLDVEVTVHKPDAPVPVPVDDVLVTIHRTGEGRTR